MKKFYHIGLFVLAGHAMVSCSGPKNNHHQNEKIIAVERDSLVGGGCDGCELMYVGMPSNLSSVDTSAGWYENGRKLLVTGKVLKSDGRTPAPDVVIYYWQTDHQGYYAPRPGMDEGAKRHGHIRGWVKTDAAGNYAIYTIRPAPYPNEAIPAHIHTSILEPTGTNEYYIDEFVFDDDPLLTSEKRKALENRGGSGILRVLVSGDLQIAEHTVILGLNIPNYPEVAEPEKISGLEIGEENPSFIPHHAFGPDKGTRTCPVCKYGRFHGVVYFVGNNPDWSEIKEWLVFLEQESQRRAKYLKVYFVYGNEKNYRFDSRQMELEKMGTELKLQNVALTFVPSMTDQESEVDLNKINPTVENTFIIYRHRTIVDKFIDFKPTPENFRLLSNTLDKTTSEYFDLAEPKHD